MNWIKITPETELPKESVLVAFETFVDEYGKSHYFYEYGELYRDMRGIVFMGSLSGFTHYCIVTPPTKEQL